MDRCDAGAAEAFEFERRYHWYAEGTLMSLGLGTVLVLLQYALRNSGLSDRCLFALLAVLLPLSALFTFRERRLVERVELYPHLGLCLTRGPNGRERSRFLPFDHVDSCYVHEYLTNVGVFPYLAVETRGEVVFLLEASHPSVGQLLEVLGALKPMWEDARLST